MTASTPRRRPLLWLDGMKGLAILWIVLNHVVEQVAGGSYLGNPTIPWVPLRERIAQLAPVHAGAFSWPLTFVRDLGWFGDEGVTLFVILSGFGLTWGLLAESAPATLGLLAFYRRRLTRIIPMWWCAHLLFLPLGSLLPDGLSTGDWRFYASLLGLRFIPHVFYYFSPAWWYVGLLLQLYLVFPFLWAFLRARGATATLVVCSAAGFAALALGPSLFPNAHFDEWQRGGIFITRLPEFSLGMALAAWWFARPAQIEATLRRPGTFVVAAGTYVVASGLALTLRGMIVAPVLLGASAFALLYPVAASDIKRISGGLRFTGRHSYAIYLVHHPFVLLMPASGAALIAAGSAFAAGATAVAATMLEWSTDSVERAIRSLAARNRALPVAAVAAVAAAIVAIPIAGDVAIAKWDPQEVNGWGERASLTPDDVFGWKMIPSKTTRLRWVSYDYTVKANQYGFPDPAFPEKRPPGTTRILVLGDAYSSAEGVDTGVSWPRLLQRDLTRAHPRRRFEVLDFAITGYGPNEEAAVAKSFVPKFRPDIVLIQYDANDVDDAVTTDDTFRGYIGFGSGPQRGLVAVAKILQWRRWLDIHVRQPFDAALHGRPPDDGYFLGAFAYLERGHPLWDVTGTGIMAKRYREIAASASAVRARTVVAWIPAPAQMCDRASLAFYPFNVDVSDATRYDLALPLERVRRAAASASIPVVPLDAALRAGGKCLYQPHNLHLTEAGHAAVASALAVYLGRM